MTCGWEITYPSPDADAPGDDLLEEFTDRALRVRAEAMAVDYLDAWTGGVFGSCPTTIRPCRHRDPYGGRAAGWAWNFVYLDGTTWPLRCGSCRAVCRCEPSRATSVVLPGYVQRVTEVRIDGAVLAPSAYAVLDGRTLVRTDGQPWPAQQDRTAAPGAPGTWEVDYVRGRPVPEGGRLAAGLLAEEFVKALTGDGSCQLPKRIQTITRQGVSIAVADNFEGLEQGKTGIYVIDAWVASVTRPPRPSTVKSPDYNRRRP